MGIAKINHVAKASLGKVNHVAKASIGKVNNAIASFVTYPARTGMHNLGNEGGDPITCAHPVVTYDAAADRLVWAYTKHDNTNAGDEDHCYILTSPVFYNPDDWGGGTVSNSADVYEPTPAGQLVSSTEARPAAIGYDSNSEICVLVYMTQESDTATYAMPFKVDTSDYSITLGTQVQLSGSEYNELDMVFDSTNNRFITHHNYSWPSGASGDAAANRPYYRTINVTSSSSGGTVQDASGESVWGPDADGGDDTTGSDSYDSGGANTGLVYAASIDRFIFAGNIDSYAKLRCATPNSDSWSTSQKLLSFGSATNVDSSAHDVSVQWHEGLDIGLVLYQNSSNHLYCRCFTVNTSTNAITLQGGSATAVYAGTVSDYSQLLYNADSAAQNFIAQYARTHSGSDRGHFKQISIDSSYNVTVGSEIRHLDLQVEMDRQTVNSFDNSPTTHFKGAYVPQANQKGIVMAAQEGGSGGSAGRTYIVWIAYTDDGTYERYEA